jgi:hypothetical protein
MSKKMITINPDLFKVSGGTGRTSRKKRSNDDTGSSRPEIKVRSSKAKTTTLKSKNHVLRFIRDQQEKTYKKMLDTPSTHEANGIDESEETFTSDFDESLKYMISLTDEQKQANDLKNRTLKQRTQANLNTHPSLLFHSSMPSIDEVVNMSVPEVFDSASYGPLSIPNLYAKPSYGCLKGGSLPTYRQVHSHNITQRRIPPQPQPIDIPSSASKLMAHESVLNTPSNILEQIKKTAEKKQNIEQISTKQPKLKYPKQRRTIRRTYRVGKSKIYPKITVLVSNRTLRNNITNKSHLLKQTSIPEIKRFLIKRGFIKVGSTAPNDVLRKMYESASLMCGEVQNHNPENLLYNYFNDVDATKS